MKNFLRLCLLLFTAIRIEAMTTMTADCDTIVKTNGELVLGTKIRNSDNMIIYQPCGGITGKTNSMPRSEVQTIRFVSIPDRIPESTVLTTKDVKVTRMAQLSFFSGLGSCLSFILFFNSLFLIYAPLLAILAFLLGGIILALVAYATARSFKLLIQGKERFFQKERHMVRAGLMATFPLAVILMIVGFLVVFGFPDP